jgi:hypothetical protein
MGSVSLTLQWMLATAGALTLAMLVMEILLASTVGSFTLPIYLLAAAAVGLPVGAAQWIILRRLVPDPGYWIPVTGAAFGVAWVVTFALLVAVFLLEMFFARPRSGLQLVACAVGAWMIGNRQAALLRRWTPAVDVWVPASIAAWTACAAVVLFEPRWLPDWTAPLDRLLTWIAGRPNSSSMEAILPGGLLAGGITGAVLPMIFDVPERPHRPDEKRAQ